MRLLLKRRFYCERLFLSAILNVFLKQFFLGNQKAQQKLHIQECL